MTKEEILKAITIIQREEKCNVREALVKFHLSEIKRIVAPLVNNQDLAFGTLCELSAVKKVLKLAGVKCSPKK